MDKEELMFLQRYKELFPNQEMFDEFMLVRGMNEKERNAHSEARRKKFAAMTPEELAEYSQNMNDGFQKFIEFAKKEIPEIALQERMVKKNSTNISWDDINRKIERAMS